MTENNDIFLRKVLVTGGAGCIGMHVCAELSKRGIVPRLFDLGEQIARVSADIPTGVEVFYGSVLDRTSVRDAVKGCDAVIHLAAYLGVRRTEQNRLRCFDINVNGTNHVLESAAEHGVKRLVFASSSEVYGEPLTTPVSESAPVNPQSVYAVTKLAGEELCKAYHQRYPELSYVILRYFNAYGPFQTAEFVIPRFIFNVQRDVPPVVYGEGDQLRSYCYATDVARATVESVGRGEADSQVLNVGNSVEAVSLMQLADLVINQAGKKEKLTPQRRGDFQDADRDASREIHRRSCDSSKAQSLLGFVAKVTLEEGIEKMLASGKIFERWAAPGFPYTQDELE